MGQIEPKGSHAVHRVVIDLIPHEEQEYDTCGNYFYDHETRELRIIVSETDDWREAMTVAVHELIEALLVLQRGISLEAITAWDTTFAGDADEPGEEPGAPYYSEHLTATVVERLFATEVGLHWPDYEDHIYQLTQEYERNHKSNHGEK